MSVSPTLFPPSPNWEQRWHLCGFLNIPEKAEPWQMPSDFQQADWNGLCGCPEADHVYHIAQAPHQHIFPYCTAVVHHGGAGTTQAATLAGCPSIVVEHASDQPLW